MGLLSEVSENLGRARYRCQGFVVGPDPRKEELDLMADRIAEEMGPVHEA